MLSIAICEDEATTRGTLAHWTERFLRSRGLRYGLREFTSAEDMVECGERFDLAIVDILLGRMNGISAARELDRRSGNTFFIFVTSEPGYVFDSFDVNVAAYLIKPPDEGLLTNALDKALRLIEQRAGSFILIKTGDGAERISCDSIVSCESVGHKVRIRTAAGEIGCYATIDSLAEELAAKSGDFFRPHRAFVVNMRYVQQCGSTDVTMSDGSTVPLARRRRPDFMRSLLRFIREDCA